MITEDEFKRICDYIVNCIDKKQKVYHIKTGISIEAVGFPYEPSPFIKLDNGQVVTYNEYPEELVDDFTDIHKALNSFGYTVVKTLLEDSEIHKTLWPNFDWDKEINNFNNFRKKLQEYNPFENNPFDYVFGPKDNTNCLHATCPTCNGTGVNKTTGGPCIHGISCPCSKCTPR